MKILLACGGSGGHLFPAMGLAAALQKIHEFLYVTGTSPLEKELLAEIPGHAVRRIPVTKIPSGWRGAGRWPGFFRDTCGALRQSFQIISEFSPHLVIGFGSYASVPAVIAARCRRIPVILHEQNMIPGKANRFLSRWSQGVAVSFPQAAGLWDFHHRVKITGNPGPLRWEGSMEPAVTFPERLKLEKGRKTLLIMGGSQGARRINTLVSQAIPRWLERHPEQKKRIQLIHLSGDADLESVKRSYRELSIPFYAASFSHEMNRLYPVSHLVIARAGATSLSELAYFGRPSILIPYPHAGAHQFENARIFKEAGAALVLEERETTPAELIDSLEELVSCDEELSRMEKTSRGLSIPDCGRRFLDFIEEVGRG